MNNKQLRLLYLVILFLSVIPTALASSFAQLAGRAQSLAASLPYYEQIITFIGLLIVFLVMFRTGGIKMAQTLHWPDNTKNAVTLSSIAIALVATVSVFSLMNERGVFLTDPLFRTILAIAVLVFVVYKYISVFRTDGKAGQMTFFLISVAIIFAYWALGKWFFPDFPDTFGEGMSYIFDIIYFLAWAFFIYSVVVFVMENIKGPKDWALAKAVATGASAVAGGAAAGAKKGYSAASRLLGGKGGSTKAKKKVAKSLERILARALRKAYRYNRKAYQDIKKANQESLKTPINRTSITTYLDEAKNFRGKLVDIDALITETIDHVDKVITANPLLKKELDTLNKLIKKELENIKTRLSGWTGITDLGLPAYIAFMITSCNKIETEILGMEMVVKGLTKHL